MSHFPETSGQAIAPESSKLRGGSTHVRFTMDQRLEIQRHAELSGESIPNLLKEAYFNGESRLPLLHREDAKAYLRELSQWGNNLNQITKALNSGFRHGFNDELAGIRKAVNAIYEAILYKSSKKNLGGY